MRQLLAVKNVTKLFGKLKAVDDVSFDVYENEIFGIAGPNGAGKTTLFNVISGLPYHASSGQISISGKRIESTRPHLICRLGLARTFQKETVFDTLSVFHNVLIGTVYGGNIRGGKSTEDKAMEALDFVGLKSKSNDEARHLALFEKKMLMLASALATNPKLILLDEPAAGLNQQEMDKTAETLRRIKAKRIAIILIEHQLPLLLRISKRVMILDNGQKLLEDYPENVVKDERVIEAYLGKRGRRGGKSSGDK